MSRILKFLGGHARPPGNGNELHHGDGCSSAAWRVGETGACQQRLGGAGRRHRYAGQRGRCRVQREYRP